MLDPCRDMDRLNVRQPPQLLALALSKKFPGSAKIGGARVVVLDLCGEELRTHIVASLPDAATKGHWLPPSALPLRDLDNNQIGIHGIHPRQLMVRVGRNCCTSSICSSRHCPSRLTKGTR